MTILVLGINHKTAPVSIREKVSFSEEKRDLALQNIQKLALADSAVILSTCNRTEVYLHNKNISPEETASWLNNIIHWFADIHHLSYENLKDYIYTKENLYATQHLMRVACGLDSLILGEPQILGQVKQAFQSSEEYYHNHHIPFSTELSRQFQKVFSTAKRVRTETNIGESAVSVAYAACNLARQIFDSLRSLNILLVGAGETIELVSRHLLRHGVKSLTIANRTRENAVNLIKKLETENNIGVISLSEIPETLAKVDIIISSTGSPNLLITQEMIIKAQKQRRNTPMLIVDIAVPRDVEETVSELDSVYHYTVDDLQNIIQKNLHEREQASEEAEEIIQQESRDFFEWIKIRQFSGLIRSYRDSAEQIRQELLEKALQSLKQGESAEQILQEMSYKLMNKLTHQPTQAMQTMVKSGNSNGLRAFSKAIDKKI